jgi:phage protein U
MNYSLPDSKRDALIGALETWLHDDQLTELQVARIVGSSQELQGTLEADELAHLAEPGAVLDEVIERWGQHGGKLVLRGIFGRHTEGENNGQPKRQTTRRFTLTRTRASQRSPSRGTESGVEALSASLGGALDTLQRQVSAQGDQQASMLSSMLERTDNATLSRVQEITTYQRTIMELKTELAREQILRAVSEAQPAVSAEVLLSVVQTLAPPVGQALAALAQRLGAPLPAADLAGPGDEAPEGPAPPPPDVAPDVEGAAQV